jgi:L,D-peptidoglycan transpeptidase YkuD (ErfK/YbiS/YcfS/YnhG family)
MKRLCSCALWFLILANVVSPALAAGRLPSDTQQLIVVVSPDWTSPQAHVFLCEKKGSQWERTSPVYEAVVGKKGMAPGQNSLIAGLFEKAGAGVTGKKEGDMKAPAGVFEVGPLMGYADKLPFGTQMKYTQTLASFQGVDDPHSKYYNQIVDTRDIPAGSADWKSFEVMKRPDILYKWLMVIHSNPRNIPGQGSMVFMHVWRAKGKGTAGCAALDEQDLLSVFKGLDAAKHPLVVLMPLGFYKTFQTGESLPVFEEK